MNCGDTVVKRAHKVKYLGVELDDGLTGEEHASGVVRKIAARISFLYRNSSLLDFKCRKILCAALIQPYFEYCCSSWYPGLTVALKSKFDVLQRRIVRFVFDLGPRVHIDTQHYKQLGWLTFPDRVKYFRLSQVNKIRNNLSPSYLSDDFEPLSGIHAHATRASLHDYFIPNDYSRGSMTSSFKYLSKCDWNKLPNALKAVSKGSSFRKKLKEFLMSSY